MSLRLVGGVLFLLAWLPLAGYVWYTYRRTRPWVGPGQVALLAGLRAAAVGLLLLLLAEPQLERWRRSVVRPGIAVLVDASASMDVLDGDRTRFQRVADALRADGLLDSLSATADVELWQFGARAERAVADSLGRLPSRGSSTDISQALQAAVERAGRRHSLDAVVLVSDGRHNLGTSPPDVAAAVGVRVYGLSVGGAAPPADLQVRGATSPPEAYVGQPAAIAVELQAWGYAGRPVVVELDESGTPLARMEVSLGADGQTVACSLAVLPRRPGAHVYRVSVQPLAGEATADNNEALVALEVRPERAAVLLLAAAPSADLAYLRRVLAADSSLAIEVRADVGAEGSDGGLAETVRLVRAARVVALVDPGAALWQEAIAASLEALLAQGGGVLTVCGPQTMAAWSAGTPPVGWLPVELPVRLAWSPGPAPVALTAAGRTHPIGRPSAQEGVADPWQQLPPLPGLVPVARVRQGAVVVLQTAGARNAPVVVAGTAGRGKVVVALSGGFWRLDLQSSGAGRSPRAVRELLANAVRWLGTQEGGSRLRAWSDKRIYRSGERVVIEAQMTDELLRPEEGAAVAARVMPPDLLVPLADRGAGSYDAAFPGLGPGEYTFVATASQAEGGVPVGEDRGAFVVEPYSLELADLRADTDLMARIGRASRGGSLPLARWRELLPELPLQQRVEPARQVTRLWPHSWVLAAVLALLTVEWLLRKRSGMI